jgi:4-amino-4-deoxy-L-arabinose transferase-like glycosyltransferase
MHASIRRSLAWDGMFLSLCLFVLVFGVGGHPIYERSEGRYAWASRVMAQEGQWLVPRLAHQAHLTKPPLTYWMQAASITALGAREWAVRLPSVIAGGITLLATWWATRRLYGRRPALLAAGLLSLMPLHVMISRIGITDGPLAMFWFGALGAGVLAWREPRLRPRWLVVFWLSVAGMMLTKGPAGLMPLASLGLWLALIGRGGDWRLFRPWLGLPLALAPLTAWAIVVALHDPAALAVWQHETLGRLQAGADHPQPFWYFLPVLLAGAFPATGAMSLPGLNYRADRLPRLARRGSTRLFWAMAVIVPLAVYSCITGKLASYMLPLCPPMAILAGLALDRWVGLGEGVRRHRPPAIAWTALAMGLAAPCAAVVVAPRLWGVSWGWSVLSTVPVAVAGVLVFASRNTTPARRGAALLVLWFTLMQLWLGALAIDNPRASAGGAPALMKQIKTVAPSARTLVQVGFFDPSMGFYHMGDLVHVQSFDHPLPLQQPGVLLLCKPHTWNHAHRRDPRLDERLRVVGQAGAGKHRLLLLEPIPSP